jgi:hypothetical protein
MLETLELGSVPANEECAQVGSPGYYDRMRAETKSYIGQLYRVLETKGYTRDKLPDSFRLVGKSFPHDYGSYTEVVAKFDVDDEAAFELAYMLDELAPAEWDDVAKSELDRFNKLFSELDGSTED